MPVHKYNCTKCFTSFTKEIYEIYNFDNSELIYRFVLLKQSLEDKILALKNDLIKVIDDKVRCSKIKYDSLISETAKRYQF